MKRKRVTSSPLSVQLMLTGQCNLKCRHCSASVFNRSNEELSSAEWIKVISELGAMKIIELAFTGGEILLRNDLFSLLDRAAHEGIPRIILNTNATLLNKDTVEQLSCRKIHKLCISLDGNRVDNDELRGEGTFSKVIESLKLLKNSSVPVEILFTPMKDNYLGFYEMVGEVIECGVKAVEFNNLHPTGRSRDSYDKMKLSFPDEVEAFLDILNRCRREYMNIKIGDFDVPYRSYPAMLEYQNVNGDNSKDIFLKPCSAGHSSCSITPDGWLVPCNELTDYKGGNVKEESIKDMWKGSDNFLKIRNLANCKSELIETCSECKYRKFCHAGCRADALAVYGDIMAVDPFCPYVST